MFFKLATKSLFNRRGSVILTLLAMTVSILVLLGVEHTRNQTRDSFANTVSGVDLIVGARTGSLNLLLYSVFRIGAPTNNIDWASYQQLAADPNIRWAVPISLGDSHKGYRVMGTSVDYFEHFRYGDDHPLAFNKGQRFESVFDVVLGAEVARKLGYSLGDKLVLAHGVAETSFSLHDDRPFTVVGILAPTGTPVDQTLHVSLQGIEAIHIDWQQGVKASTAQSDPEQLRHEALKPEQLTAILLGLESRLATFNVQRKINDYQAEPLMAILPGVALTELWQVMGILENTLRLVSVLVLIAALLGLAAMLLASIREREHEIQLLRVIGASPLFLFGLLQLEALLIAGTSIVLGAGGLYLALLLTRDLVAAQFGLQIGTAILGSHSLLFLLLILIATAVVASIPAINAYQSAKQL